MTTDLRTIEIDRPCLDADTTTEDLAQWVRRSTDRTGDDTTLATYARDELIPALEQAGLL